MSENPLIKAISPRFKTQKTSDTVPISGIYDVVGDKVHDKPHQVTCVKNERFPPCAHCNKGVSFRLRYAAKHLSEEPSFH
jgi:hypothetical protein